MGGTAIAYAPTLGELRHPVNGGKNIVHNDHGHGARSNPSANPDYPAVTTTETKAPTDMERTENVVQSPALVDGPATPSEEGKRVQISAKEKHNWKETSRNALAVG